MVVLLVLWWYEYIPHNKQFKLFFTEFTCFHLFSTFVTRMYSFSRNQNDFGKMFQMHTKTPHFLDFDLIHLYSYWSRLFLYYIKLYWKIIPRNKAATHWNRIGKNKDVYFTWSVSFYFSQLSETTKNIFMPKNKQQRQC